MQVWHIVKWIFRCDRRGIYQKYKFFYVIWIKWFMSQVRGIWCCERQFSRCFDHIDSFWHLNVTWKCSISLYSNFECAVDKEIKVKIPWILDALMPSQHQVPLTAYHKFWFVSYCLNWFRHHFWYCEKWELELFTLAHDLCMYESLI